MAPLQPDNPESRMRLDFAAVRWCMDAHGIPLRQQLPAWRLVQLLHDVRWHRDGTVGWYCQAHAWDLDEGDGYDPACARCRGALGVDEEEVRSHGAGC